MSVLLLLLPILCRAASSRTRGDLEWEVESLWWDRAPCVVTDSVIAPSTADAI